MCQVDTYLKELKNRFNMINPKEYYLSYSGGKDSHLLYWFIKEYLKNNDIAIIGVDTRLEHQEILKRINNNSDKVLYPELEPFEIKEKYGIPCFSKWQDEMIYRYQKGSRRPYLIERITGIHKDTGEKIIGRFKLNNTAKKLLLNEQLHKVSPKCCEYLKKKPLREYEKATNKKAILGVRGDEGTLRKQQYTSCFTKNGKFTPIFDLSDELLNQIYSKYNIELPKIYKYLQRTGCMGCPYGSYRGDTQKELELVGKEQRKLIYELFKESYEVLKINP
ncbi:phosphoadenosine phosphosulfate reductase family protein [uncultured Clostridium sp.]|jgi:3'-phosphoadenosine 5'-phosphosulfate sulfotransferase (PAPS reductase)/FAD synthetase|uniref:phosphoadenosine phosphosulfate reductase family protein n=1 Tax=uncultured Clostridium sp. TaxID=59620 RepID=UPI00272BA0A6|nr:phosphoadenosine phosphosulfate reductase family protein [uncultured Clostridium sp.]